MKATRTLLLPLLLSVMFATLLRPPCARTQDAQQRGLAVSANSGAKAGSSFYALVIGNNTYQKVQSLRTAENDARAVEATLRESYGFKTKLLLNATRQQIIAALNSYRRELDADSNLLIYYAGHGVNDKEIERAYWLPVDAEPDDNSNWISADDITSNIRGVPARHILIVSDSCYSGTLSRGLDVVSSVPAVRERYLQKMSAGRSRTLMASGGDEPVADGGGGNHSVFASALVRGLQQTEKTQFTAAELYREYIEEPVAGRASQTPQYNPLRNSGHESGDFVFVRVKTPDGKTIEVTVATAPTGSVDPAAVELSFWDSVKSSTDPEDFKAYLQQYPSGQFAALAKNRLKNLEKGENAMGAAAETAKPAKSFTGSYGIWGSFGSKDSTLSGELNIAPGNIEFIPKDKSAFDKVKAFYNAPTAEKAPLSCANFEKARLDNNFIRDVYCDLSQKGWKCRFAAESAAAAASVLTAIQEACNPSAHVTPTTSTGGSKSDSLEGTTWKGSSPGGDKKYEFQFLPNGEVTLIMKWNSAGTSRGTWRRTGDAIKMDFRPWWTDPFEATISGDTMTGSWAKGQYKFTLTKVP